jgi:hypothetical protein
MIEELENLISYLPFFLQDEAKWDSLLIDKYPPVIYRLSLKLTDDRTLILHKLFNCEGQQALMHSHSWPFAIKVVEGGYGMGVGFSSDRNHPPQALYKQMIKSGDTYEMNSSDVWHYTKPLKHTEASYSIMLVGNRWRERFAQNNDPLTDQQRREVFDYFNNIR